MVHAVSDETPHPQGPRAATVPDDPEQARVDALVHRLVRGEASEAERVELELYAERDPGLLARIERARQVARLGGTWLARVEADAEIARAERSRWVRAQRVVGGVLVAAGWVAQTAGAVAVGGGLLAAGVLTLLASWLRHARKDPYKEIER